MDTRNVVDKFKGWPEELIRKNLASTAFNFGIAGMQIAGDFNFGTLVRNANAFGAKEVFYIGRKRWDRRGAVGTYKYTNVSHLGSERLFLEHCGITPYTLVAIENNNSAAVDLRSFVWPPWPLMLFGEESLGLSDFILSSCEHVVQIPQFGSVRSINVGSASAIIMYDYICKLGEKNGQDF